MKGIVCFQREKKNFVRSGWTSEAAGAGMIERQNWGHIYTRGAAVSTCTGRRDAWIIIFKCDTWMNEINEWMNTHISSKGCIPLGCPELHFNMCSFPSVCWFGVFEYCGGKQWGRQTAQREAALTAVSTDERRVWEKKNFICVNVWEWMATRPPEVSLSAHLLFIMSPLRNNSRTESKTIDSCTSSW